MNEKEFIEALTAWMDKEGEEWKLGSKGYEELFPVLVKSVSDKEITLEEAMRIACGIGFLCGIGKYTITVG